MTIFDMLGQSGTLSLLGMAIVFSFLVILVICVSIMGRIIQALGQKKDPIETDDTVQAAGQVSGSSNNAAVTAAITAAVNEYRNNQS